MFKETPSRLVDENECHFCLVEVKKRDANLELSAVISRRVCELVCFCKRQYVGVYSDSVNSLIFLEPAGVAFLVMRFT
jgi:hypothetical protein